MRKLITLLLLLNFSLSRGQADTALVRDIMLNQEKSWNKGDIPAFMEGYWKSDSLKFIGSKGISYGWQKVLGNYLKSYPDKKAMGELHFYLYEITRLSPESIYVIGKWELIKEKPVSGHFTLLWKKINGQWLIVSDHTS